VKKLPESEPFAEANDDRKPAGRMGVFERLAKKPSECNRTIEHKEKKKDV
jgi:hypothetical protein